MNNIPENKPTIKDEYVREIAHHPEHGIVVERTTYLPSGMAYGAGLRSVERVSVKPYEEGQQ